MRALRAFVVAVVALLGLATGARSEAPEGYWRRVGLGEVTTTPASWQQGNFSLVVHSVTRNSYDATFAGSPPTNARPAPATRATLEWADPPDALVPGERVPLSASVKSAAAPGGPMGVASLAMVFDLPGLAWSAVTDSVVRLLTIEASGSKEISDVPLPRVGSGRRVLYVRAGFGERSTLQVSFPYEFVAGKPPATTAPGGRGADRREPGSGGRAAGGAGTAPPGAGERAGPGTTADGRTPGGALGGAPRGLSTPAGPHAATTLTLEVGANYAAPGEAVVVPVWLAAAEGVGNLDVEIRFDIGRATGVRESADVGLAGDRALEFNVAEQGVARIGIAAPRGLSGTGTLVLLELTAPRGAPGDRVALRGHVKACHGVDGTARIVRVVDGEIRLMTPDGRVPGDADGDGVVTESDARIALRMSVGLLPPRLELDVDSDGTVTSADARILFQRARPR